MFCSDDKSMARRRRHDAMTARHDGTTSSGSGGTAIDGNNDNVHDGTTAQRHTARRRHDDSRGQRQRTSRRPGRQHDENGKTKSRAHGHQKAFCKSRQAGRIGETKKPFRELSVKLHQFDDLHATAVFWYTYLVTPSPSDTRRHTTLDRRVDGPARGRQPNSPTAHTTTMVRNKKTSSVCW